MKIVVKISTLALISTLYTFSASSHAQEFSPDLTEFGHPDFRGVWNFSNKTPLERPERFAGQEFLNDEEMETPKGKDHANEILSMDPLTQDEIASVTTPVMQLRGFERLPSLAPGASAKVVRRLPSGVSSLNALPTLPISEDTRVH